MVKKHRVCADPACTKLASFAAAGSRPEYCSAHANKEEMVDVKNKKCAHPDCTKYPSYGTEGTRTRIFCSLHAEQGMVPLYGEKYRKSRRRLEETPKRQDRKPRENLSKRISERCKPSADKLGGDGRGRRGREDGLSLDLADGPAHHDPSFSRKHRSADQSTEPKKKRTRLLEDAQLATPLATAVGDGQAKPTAAVESLCPGADSSGRWVSTGGNHWVFRPWGT